MLSNTDQPSRSSQPTVMWCLHASSLAAPEHRDNIARAAAIHPGADEVLGQDVQDVEVFASSRRLGQARARERAAFHFRTITGWNPLNVCNSRIGHRLEPFRIESPRIGTMASDHGMESMHELFVERLTSDLGDPRKLQCPQRPYSSNSLKPDPALKNGTSPGQIPKHNSFNVITFCCLDGGS
nr:hypothetical protein CFP56_32328 [Quercus suber]